jgi:glycosyltransferase involved in cell wall biosynthesis
MKVLFFSRFFYPHIGGVEVHISNLAKSLLGKKNFEISLITERFDPNLPDEEVLCRIKVLRLSYPKLKWVGLISIWISLISNYFEEFKKADIIHIHDIFIWYLPIRFLFPRKKVFVTFHGYSSYPPTKKAIVYQKLAEKLTDGNICVGKFVEKWYGTKPTIITYGAVDLTRFNYSAVSIKYDGIFFGRLDTQTGINTYLKAVEILKSKDIDFRLLVLGDGECKRNAMEISSHWEPFVVNPARYVKKSRVVFASGYLSILESFACKKLVFAAYNDPLKRDYLEMTPFAKWIIVENDAKKLAEDLVDYFENPSKYQDMIDKAYEWVRGQTWEKMAENYLKLWGKK